ncbi:MAG: DUF420 domain-containing protein [Leptospiraceae bacterium]|nr:DUF420 domain-containing protein [Leptospiraceae bacterium]
MAYWIVTSGMSVASLCFAVGLYTRKNRSSHRLWMSAGIACVLSAAVALLASIYLFGDGDRSAAGFYPTVDEFWITIHRLIAAIATVLMLFMAGTGYFRKADWHRRAAIWFILLYSIVYFSGLFLFESAR